MPPLPVVLSHCQLSNRGFPHCSLIISLPPLSLHGNAPPNPNGDDDEDDNEDDKEDGNKDEGDVMTTFDKVACHLQGSGGSSGSTRDDSPDQQNADVLIGGGNNGDRRHD